MTEIHPSIQKKYLEISQLEKLPLKKSVGKAERKGVFADTALNRARRRVGQPIPPRTKKEKVIASQFYVAGDLLVLYQNWGPASFFQVTSVSTSSSILTIRPLLRQSLQGNDYFGSGEVWAFRNEFDVRPQAVEEKVRVLSGGKLSKLHGRNFNRYTAGDHEHWAGYNN